MIRPSRQIDWRYRALQLQQGRKMDEDARIAKALNHLGKNADLFAADSENLLDLIEDYFDADTTEDGKTRPNPLAFSTHHRELIYS